MRRVAGWLKWAPALVILGLAGCASPAMKGTPFYSGEYGVRQGPVEDRINFWPLLYYRKPALSVLWPIGEKTDDHVAIRPLLSVSGLANTQAVVSVLWPLSSVDTHSGDGYAFPVFWGRERLVVFPLYWHFEEPFGPRGGYDALLPLWSYRRAVGSGYNTHILWPILHFKNIDREHGWGVWPLYGTYTDDVNQRRYYVFPLGAQWRDAGDRGHMFLPLYYASHNARSDRFYALPFSRVARSNGTGWQLAPPLWFERHAPDDRLVATLLGGYRRHAGETGWVALPLLSGGSTGRDGNSLWFLGPLAHTGTSAAEHSDHIAPFYYRARDAASSTFISLPWSQAANRDGSGWQLAPPFCFRLWDTNSAALVTPLYARGTTAAGGTWRGVFPLVYARTAADQRLVATPLGGYQRAGERTSWVAVPALAAGRTSPQGHDVWAAAGLVHVANGATGARQHVLPLYYWNQASGTLLSLPFAQVRNDQRTLTVIPPALSWMTQRADRRDWWVLGPLAHFSSGPERGSSHVFPLYYRSPDADWRLSPLYARMGEADDKVVVIPPLLSVYRRDGEAHEVIAGLGLFRQRWGRNVPDAGHLFPLYAFESGHAWYTPLCGRCTDPDGLCYPLTPLVGVYTGARSGGWVFPLWSRERDRASGSVTGHVLWGDFTRAGDERTADLFPMYDYRAYAPLAAAPTNTDHAADFGSSLTVLGLYRQADLLTVRPSARFNSAGQAPCMERERTREQRLLPLWSFKSRAQLDAGTCETKGSALLILYDYRHTVTPAPSAATHDYRRARVLWRLWHYERADGDVSVDVFPAITYDHHRDGLRKISFLWRAFRYESSAGRRDVDLLFVPVWRGGAGAAPKPEA